MTSLHVLCNLSMWRGVLPGVILSLQVLCLRVTSLDYVVILPDILPLFHELRYPFRLCMCNPSCCCVIPPCIVCRPFVCCFILEVLCHLFRHCVTSPGVVVSPLHSLHYLPKSCVIPLDVVLSLLLFVIPPCIFFIPPGVVSSV